MDRAQDIRGQSEKEESSHELLSVEIGREHAKDARSESRWKRPLTPSWRGGEKRSARGGVGRAAGQAEKEIFRWALSGQGPGAPCGLLALRREKGRRSLSVAGVRLPPTISTVPSGLVCHG